VSLRFDRIRIRVIRAFGESWYTHTPKLTWYHLEAIDIKFQICAHAFLPFLWGTGAWIHSKTLHQYNAHKTINTINVIQLVRYHYTYAPRPILGNIGIPICLAQSIHPSQCHAYFCFVSRSCPIGINHVSKASTLLSPPIRHPP